MWPFSNKSTKLKKSISAAVQGLSRIDYRLASRIVDYIMTGNDEEALLLFANYGTQVYESLGKPANYYLTNYNYVISGRNADFETHLKNRRSVYQLYAPEYNNIFLRLAKMYKEAIKTDSTQAKQHGKDLNAIRLLYTDVAMVFKKRNENHTTRLDTGRLDIVLMHNIDALLKCDDENNLGLLECIMNRSRSSYYVNSLLNRLDLKLPVQYWARRNPGEFVAQAKMLPAVAREEVIEVIPHDSIDQFASLLVQYSIEANKEIATTVAQLLKKVSPELIIKHVLSYLKSGSAGQRKGAARMLSIYAPDDAEHILHEHFENEKTASVRSYIENLFQKNKLVEKAASQIPEISLPSYKELPETKLDEDYWTDVLWQMHSESIPILKKAADEEASRNNTSPRKTTYAWSNYNNHVAVKKNEYKDFIAGLNGTKTMPRSGIISNTFFRCTPLLNSPDFGIYQIIRFQGNRHRSIDRFLFNAQLFVPWVNRQNQDDLDLRQFIAPLLHEGHSEQTIEVACLGEYRWENILPYFPEQGVWPFFSDKTGLLLSALQGAKLPGEVYSCYSPQAAIEVISRFPVLPPRLISTLIEFALGDRKTLRTEVQDILTSVPGIQSQVEPAIKKGKKEVRITAARWAARAGWKECIPLLKEAAAKETKADIRAEFLSALASLGELMNDYFTPDFLTKEAEKDHKLHQDLDILKLDALADLYWIDGNVVDKQVLNNWIQVAYKMKKPGGTYLQKRQLECLTPESRQELALFLMRSFIDADTLKPTISDSEQYAEKNAQNRLSTYKSYGSYFADMTLENAYKGLYNEHQSRYLQSANSVKGVLALCAYIPGTEAVALIQSYTKHHYQRWHQVIALLRAAAAGNDPLVIQLLLSIARRYRQNSVKEEAALLIEEIAEKNNWTPNELADRTIPTAGYDDDGWLELDYGRRLFKIGISEDLKPVILNEAGKPIKSLPAPTQADDAEKAKAAKSEFSTIKKTIKQLVDMQSKRLHEAMCVQLEWKAVDWTEYLYKHPIMKKLIQPVIWHSSKSGYFRIAEDLCLLNTEDDEIELSADELITVAHSCVMNDSDRKAWAAYLKENRIKPLFPQLYSSLNKEIEDLLIDSDSDMIVSRVGWYSDSYTLRSAFTKRNYLRGQTEDAGYFYTYYKDFSTSGYRVEISFTGNAMPEENVPAALKELRFFIKDKRRYSQQLLKDIPPVLLAEAYSDYLEIAKKCSGFEPDWAQKCGW